MHPRPGGTGGATNHHVRIGDRVGVSKVLRIRFTLAPIVSQESSLRRANTRKREASRGSRSARSPNSLSGCRADRRCRARSPAGLHLEVEFRRSLHGIRRYVPHRVETRRNALRTLVCLQGSRSYEAIPAGLPVRETRPHTLSDHGHSPRILTQRFDQSHCSLCRALLLQVCERQTGSSLLLLSRRGLFPRPQRGPRGRYAAC